jgi:hypothetical protein
MGPIFSDSPCKNRLLANFPAFRTNFDQNFLFLVQIGQNYSKKVFLQNQQISSDLHLIHFLGQKQFQQRLLG